MPGCLSPAPPAEASDARTAKVIRRDSRSPGTLPSPSWGATGWRGHRSQPGVLRTGLLRAPPAAGKQGRHIPATSTPMAEALCSFSLWGGRRPSPSPAKTGTHSPSPWKAPSVGRLGPHGEAPTAQRERGGVGSGRWELGVLLEAPSPPSLPKCPGGGSLPASPTLRSSTNSSMTGQHNPTLTTALPHPSAPLHEAGCPP